MEFCAAPAFTIRPVTSKHLLKRFYIASKSSRRIKVKMRDYSTCKYYMQDLVHIFCNVKTIPYFPNNDSRKQKYLPALNF